jgi:anti-sigma B factor antagonist
MNLSICVRRSADHALVSVEGDVDLNSAPLLQQRLMYLLEGNGPRLLIDLSGVTFIDCFATRMLAEMCRRAEGSPCSVQFVALSEPVERLAELTGLGGELPVAPCGGPAVPQSVSAMTESGAQRIPGPTIPGTITLLEGFDRATENSAEVNGLPPDVELVQAPVPELSSGRRGERR